jgi:hypothetical protein
LPPWSIHDAKLPRRWQRMTPLVSKTQKNCKHFLIFAKRRAKRGIMLA